MEQKQSRIWIRNRSETEQKQSRIWIRYSLETPQGYGSGSGLKMGQKQSRIDQETGQRLSRSSQGYGS